MSFAEFQIRLFAWSRMQEREWEKVRILAWHIEASSFHRKKAMPSLENFMPLSLDIKHNSGGISESQKKRFLEVSEEYFKQLKSK